MAGLIKREDIDEVRQRTDIKEVVDGYVTLKSAGLGSFVLEPGGHRFACRKARQAKAGPARPNRQRRLSAFGSGLALTESWSSITKHSGRRDAGTRPTQR